MIAKIFDTNNPLILVIIFIVGILFWLTAFIQPVTLAPMPEIMPLYRAFFGLLNYSYLLTAISAYLLLFMEAFILNQIIINNKLFNRSSYLTAMIYILLMSSYKPLLTFSPILIANFFLLISLKKIFDIYEEEEPFEQLFNIGFFTSIASLFYFPSIYFIAVVFICLIIFKIFKWRVWVIFLAGIILPYIFASVYYFMTNKFFAISVHYLDYFSSINFITYDYSKELKIFIPILASIGLLSAYKVLNESREKLIKIRLSYLVILWFLFISIIFLFIGKDNHTSFFGFSFIPLSIIISNYIQHIKKFYVKEIIFTLFVLLIIFSNLYL